MGEQLGKLKSRKVHDEIREVQGEALSFLSHIHQCIIQSQKCIINNTNINHTLTITQSVISKFKEMRTNLDA